MDFNDDLLDDDDLTLSPEAMMALNEFLKERDNQNSAISENWQLSQFWYNSETTNKLVEELILQRNKNSRIACISCPTIHIELIQKNVPSTLLEFDNRFEIYHEFIQYDYNYPFDIPSSLEGQFDIIIVDPPFLSEECLTKVCKTVGLLSTNDCYPKIILCTGKIQEELASKLLNVKLLKNFEPKHESRLSNEFGCFVNFDTVILDK